ncbi:effector-associated constant component EACC1 [Desulfobacca acetoxidans]
MNIILRITSKDLDAEDLQEVTNSLSMTLRDDTDIAVNLPEEAASPGAKGDPVTLGTLILTALTSGTVVALFNVLKSYFDRGHSLEIELHRSDGKTIKIKAENLQKAQIDSTIKIAQDFLGG